MARWNQPNPVKFIVCSRCDIWGFVYCHTISMLRRDYTSDISNSINVDATVLSSIQSNFHYGSLENVSGKNTVPFFSRDSWTTERNFQNVKWWCVLSFENVAWWHENHLLEEANWGPTNLQVVAVLHRKRLRSGLDLSLDLVIPDLGNPWQGREAGTTNWLCHE